MQPQQVSDEEVYHGSLIRVLRRTLATSSGGRSQFDIVEHPDAVAIVALRDDPAHPGSMLVALVQQERPAINRRTWELPAGLVSTEEIGQPEQTARRELREETGYDAGNLKFLTRTYSSPGFTNEAISLYLATGLQPVPGQSGPQDPTEIGGVSWVPLSDALARCARGEIDDSKSVLGLLLARDVSTQTGASSASQPRPSVVMLVAIWIAWALPGSLALGIAVAVITQLVTQGSLLAFTHPLDYPLAYGVGIGVFLLEMVLMVINYRARVRKQAR